MTENRLYFLDNLRIALVCLVIAHHVGQAYGPTGGWWPIQEIDRTKLLGPFFGVNRSFFMSLFFMIAGYFTVMSCDAKGPQAFIKDRFVRLGRPLLVFALCMIPVQMFLIDLPGGQSHSAWPINVGYMWFIEHLLIFGVCFALWQIIFKSLPATGAPQTDPPGNLSILVFALVLALVSAFVRQWFPIDKWIIFFGFISVAFADVPRDLSFFIIGIVIYRRQWLFRFPTRQGYVWLAVGVLASLLLTVYLLVLRDIYPISKTAMHIAFPVWESILCCGMCIGLTVLFREKFNFQGRLGKILAQSQYAAYIFHVPILTLFQGLMLGVQLPPLAKFALVTAVSIPVTFLFSSWVRKPLRL